MQVHDVVTTTEALIRGAGIRSADDVRSQSKSLVQYSPARRALNLELRDYLYRNLYYNKEVHRPNLRAVRMLKDLFEHYLEHPSTMGILSRKRIRKDGLHRAICDYLSGMTDRYAMQEHGRIFGSLKRDVKRET